MNRQTRTAALLLILVITMAGCRPFAPEPTPIPASTLIGTWVGVIEDFEGPEDETPTQFEFNEDGLALWTYNPTELPLFDPMPFYYHFDGEFLALIPPPGVDASEAFPVGFEFTGPGTANILFYGAEDENLSGGFMVVELTKLDIVPEPTPTPASILIGNWIGDVFIPEDPIILGYTQFEFSEDGSMIWVYYKSTESLELAASESYSYRFDGESLTVTNPLDNSGIFTAVVEFMGPGVGNMTLHPQDSPYAPLFIELTKLGIIE